MNTTIITYKRNAVQRSVLPGLAICLVLTVLACKEEKAPEPVPEEPKPTAGFTFSQDSEDDPFTFTFKNESSNFKIIRWEFGDDSVSLDESPTHTYLRPEDYRVKLVTENGQGYWAQKETFINIRPDSLVQIDVARPGNGQLKLSVNTTMAVDSTFWYRGLSPNLELLTKDPTTTIAVESGAFEDYTLEVLTPKGSLLQISKLFTDLGIVNDVTAKGHLTVSRDNDGGPTAGEGSLKLVDNSKDTKFLQFNYDGSLWCELEYYEPVTISAYTFTIANDAPERDPKDWHISGSNDREHWTELDNRTGALFTLDDRKMAFTYRFNNTTPYLYYRLYVTAVNSSNLFQLSEWRVLELPQ